MLDGRSGQAPWQNMTKTFGSRSVKEHAAHLLPHLKPSDRILDVGCGLGSITADLASVVSEGAAIGLDSNPQTTKLARQRSGVDNLTFVDGDALDLSRFESESFDVVHAHQVILHLAKPGEALSEMRRVLKTGGILTIRDNIDLFHFPHDNMIQKNQDWFREFCRKSGGDPQAGLRSHVWVHEAGFPWDKIQFSAAAWEYSGSEARHAWAEGAKNGFRTIGLNAGYGTATDYDEIEQRWTAWAEKEEGRIFGLDGVVLAWK